MSAAAWVAHVKLRKKRASAKRYVKKKARIQAKEDAKCARHARKHPPPEYLWREAEFVSLRNSMHYGVRGYPFCRIEEKKYCVLCDGIELDLRWMPEGIDKWYVRNFCFRERLSGERWVMHRRGVGMYLWRC